MSYANGSGNSMSRTSRRNGQDATAALRMRRYRQRKNDKENNASVTVDQAGRVTISTAEMCALGARLSDGCASREDMQLADRLIVAFAGMFPRDSVVTIVAGEIPADQDDQP